MTRTTSPHPLPGSAGRATRSIRPPEWLVILGGIAAAFAVLFAVTRLSPADAYAPLFTGGPRAQIGQSRFDYGDVKNNTRVQTTFTIQNVGDKQLYFAQEPVVQVVEGCCPPSARDRQVGTESGRDGAGVAQLFDA